VHRLNRQRGLKQSTANATARFRINVASPVRHVATTRFDDVVRTCIDVFASWRNRHAVRTLFGYEVVIRFHCNAIMPERAMAVKPRSQTVAKSLGLMT
jgi:hypothetical protein